MIHQMEPQNADYDINVKLLEISVISVEEFRNKPISLIQFPFENG